MSPLNFCIQYLYRDDLVLDMQVVAMEKPFSLFGRRRTLGVELESKAISIGKDSCLKSY